jgi:hypothetical protein
MLLACCSTVGIVGADAVTMVVPELSRLPRFEHGAHGTLRLLPYGICLAHTVWLAGLGPPASVWVACVGGANTKRCAWHLPGIV